MNSIAALPAIETGSEPLNEIAHPTLRLSKGSVTDRSDDARVQRSMSRDDGSNVMSPQADLVDFCHSTFPSCVAATSTPPPFA